MKRTENPHEEIFMVRHTSWEDRDLDWIQDVPNQRFGDWQEGYNTCLADVVREVKEEWTDLIGDFLEGDGEYTARGTWLLARKITEQLADELSQNIGESGEVSRNSNKEANHD